MAHARPLTIAHVASSPRRLEPLGTFLALASILLSAPMADRALQAASMADGVARLLEQYCRGGGGDMSGAATHSHHAWLAGCSTLLPPLVPRRFI